MLDKVILQNTYKNINNKDELSNVVEGLFIEAFKHIQVFSFKHDVKIKILNYELKTINVINAMRLIMFIDITKLTNNDVNYYVN
jgi:hypothetical protein